jgi:nucleoside-diphosphate-sugar epimerase
MTGTALILGPNGRFGRHVATALAQRGWTLQRFDRQNDDLDRAAEGADLIVNGWNPPYPDWAAQLPGQTAAIRRAAERSGATVLVPGNVYVFGPEAPERLGSDTPHRAHNPLGRLRIEMEQSWRDSNVQVILLRCGDFLDDAASGNWFDRVMAPKLTKGSLTYPGRPDIPHAWAYLPDVARAAADLVERREALPRFAEIPFPGHTLTGQALGELCAAALGRPVRIAPFAWWQLALAMPVWPMARHLREMRYLWDMPHRLEAETLAASLPDFRASSPAEAVASAVGAALADRAGQPSGAISAQTSR